MPLSACEFLLTDILEDEVQSESGYDIFEPTMVLKISGKNAFEAFGITGVKHVVVMHFREEALRETKHILQQLDWRIPVGTHEFFLLGSPFGILLERSEEHLEVSVQDHYGAQGQRGAQAVGATTVRDWVEAVATLARNLSNRFRKAHPSLFSDPMVMKQEMVLQELESWHIARGP